MYFMKLLYPSPSFTGFLIKAVKAVLTIVFLIVGFSAAMNAQQAKELVFKNSILKSGTAGADHAVYLFANVMPGTDALVKINGRSSSMVQLVTIDLTNTGFEKSFQPQVTYGVNNTTPAGNTEWWMEFQVSFVNAGTNNPAAISSFNVTGLDIDGNNDKISEYQAYYGQKTYTMESNSELKVSTMQENVNGKRTNVGKCFDGPVTHYQDVDTSATTVMVTNAYENVSTFKLRTGAKSTGISGAADRMYSLWFKAFAYEGAVTGFLPVTLINWTAALSNSNISLKWSTSTELNASHFIIERSFDGTDYADAAMIFAAGNSNMVTNYSFNDKLPAGNTGTIYYRLKMVDADGRYKTSDTRIVRIGKSTDAVKVIAYPNPVVNELRITIPQNWQGRQVNYRVSNANGQVIKAYVVQYASQTETINMTQVPAGMYVVSVINGTETAVQPVIKSGK
jgi:hypothetical protein